VYGFAGWRGDNPIPNRECSSPRYSSIFIKPATYCLGKLMRFLNKVFVISEQLIVISDQFNHGSLAVRYVPCVPRRVLA